MISGIQWSHKLMLEVLIAHVESRSVGRGALSNALARPEMAVDPLMRSGRGRRTLRRERNVLSLRSLGRIVGAKRSMFVFRAKVRCLRRHLRQVRDASRLKRSGIKKIPNKMGRNREPEGRFRKK